MPHSSPNTYSLFNSCSKLMKILSGASLLPQYILLIQFLFKIDGNALWSLTPPSTYSLCNSYSKLMKILSAAPSSPSTYSLFNSYSKYMKILYGPHTSSITYSSFNSYSKIDENTLWRPILPQYIFLIQFGLKTDETPLWSLPPP